MLQACIFRSTSPPGPCDKVILGYHSLLENGNPKPKLKKSISHPPTRRLLPNTHQQSPFPTKLKRPMEGGNDHAEEH